jgi:hypothetical protein
MGEASRVPLYYHEHLQNFPNGRFDFFGILVCADASHTESPVGSKAWRRQHWRTVGFLSDYSDYMV